MRRLLVNAPSFPELPPEAERPLVAPPAVASLERKRIRAYLALIVIDIAVILACFLIGGMLYRGVFPDAQALLEAQLFIPLYLTIALYQRVFSIRSLTDGEYAAMRVAIAVLVAAALLNLLAFYAKFNTSFSRGTFTLGISLSALAMAMIRFRSARLLRKRWGPIARNVLILDAGGPQFTLDHAVLVKASDAGLRPEALNPHMRSRIAEFLVNQEEVIVSCPPGHRDAWSLILKASGVHGEIVSDAPEHKRIIGITQHPEAGVTGIVYSTGPLGLRARLLKRLFDLIVAGTGTLVLAPIALVISMAIKLESPGPVLFIQQRLGRGNRMFSMLKFRSMRAEHADLEGGKSASREDDRVTRVGRFLRRTSLDELPQLINVLRGDMSIVGPRPHALGSQAGDKLFWEVDGEYWNRHSLKPGLTGLAQIRGLRGATVEEGDLSDRLSADLEYIADWSLLRDVIITIRTLAVVTHDRAY